MIIKIERMIEPGLQYRRGTPVILRGSQNDNHVGETCVVARGAITNFAVDVDAIHRQGKQANESDCSSPLEDPADHATRLLIRPLKNCARESNGNGPSRKTTGGSTDRSSNVDPSREGSTPPSTSASRESPSWLRTSSALTAEGIPLRLALVAVTGLPKRLTRAVAN